MTQITHVLRNSAWSRNCLLSICGFHRNNPFFLCHNAWCIQALILNFMSLSHIDQLCSKHSWVPSKSVWKAVNNIFCKKKTCIFCLIITTWQQSYNYCQFNFITLCIYTVYSFISQDKWAQSCGVSYIPGALRYVDDIASVASTKAVAQIILKVCE